ncbi:ras family-domain-containing protein [Anaeramoeba flamelloides]|uniref:Ras family-domain-containing protein n=1 Tax=Anaeramoeba flamelloides TaxID=1746091 RepID=A0AAV7YCM4_9EUKA|nr:ras family-domain-containing protein [Anaeramoeba flamelloides]KAJ6235162.1 ras family-domain-containing protein [Anaeramoeba flamelloides]
MSSSDSEEENSVESCVIKIVMLGTSGCGKTSIVQQYTKGTFTTKTGTTIGAAFAIQKLFIQDQIVSLRIWDTSGQERFRSLVPLYYRKVQAAIFVFDITDKNSLNGLSFWYDQLKQELKTLPLLVVAANKIDLKENNQNYEELINTGKKYSKKIGAKFYITSAKTAEGIKEIFEYISNTIVEMDKLKEDSEEFTKGGSREIYDIIDDNNQKNGNCC